MTSIGRFQWSTECENAVNEQILLEYWASLQYHALFSYFDKDSIGLNHIAQFFNKSSLEEREHAHKLITYQNKRGGDVILSNIMNIDNNNWYHNKEKSDVLCAFEKALEMEQIVYKSLLNLHKIGTETNDPQFTDFLEGEYLEEQIDAINELSKYIAQLRRIGSDGHGLWNFNKQFVNCD